MRKAKEEMYMEEKNKPEKRFSTGVISATIWNNQGTTSNGQVGTYKTISLQRRYKDKSGVWKSTNYLRLNDLPKASLVLDKAYEYLVLREDADSNNMNEAVEIEDIY